MNTLHVALLDLVMGLAAYRLWRVAGQDTWPITRAPREFLQLLAEFWSDPEGPRYRPALGWIARESFDFITCPWCAGSFSAALVIGITAQFASVPLPLLQWAAVACVVGLIGKVDGD